jgi:hypothetical protein
MAGQLAMTQIALIGLGAGAAAALLSASIASGSVFAIILFYLAPLPILIAALGWSHWAGLIAAVSAATGLALVLGLFSFLAFLIGVGIPAWWLGYLALLARPVGGNGAAPVLEWYPIGRVVFWAALIGFLIVAFAVPNFGTDAETFQAGLRSQFERVLRTAPSPADLPGAPARADRSRLIEILVVLMPPLAAMFSTLTNVINLWLAGRIVRVSGRLKRPWPDLSELALPGYAAGLLALAIVASFMSGLVGILAGVLTATLLIAFALHGFAVLHAITRGMNARAFMLAGAYAAALVFGWPVLLMSMLGLVDVAINLRQRIANRRGPPTLRT